MVTPEEKYPREKNKYVLDALYKQAFLLQWITSELSFLNIYIAITSLTITFKSPSPVCNSLECPAGDPTLRSFSCNGSMSLGLYWPWSCSRLYKSTVNVLIIIILGRSFKHKFRPYDTTKSYSLGLHNWCKQNKWGVDYCVMHIMLIRLDWNLYHEHFIGIHLGVMYYCYV